MMKKLPCICLLAFFACAARAEDKLVVHEWGTFTSLQDEQGKAIGGINTDDEPVPNFVHRIGYNLLLSPSEAPPKFFQDAPSCHPDVTMRLETPVIYFYPPNGWKPQPVDVHVAFRGGWLTEFYPDAEAKAPGFDAKNPDRIFTVDKIGGFSTGHIKRDTAGELTWKNVTLGAESAGPETTEKVWLAPRAVKSAAMKTAKGEIEKFLFYRGVGNVDAPLRIVRNETEKTLEVHDVPRILAMINAEEHLRIHAAWFVDVRADGTCAFKTMGKLEWGKEVRAVMPASFNADDFSAGNMPRLQKEMRDALIGGGLFSDEADALLNTWQASYFKSPGLRFFYLCPRVDIDSALPLEISAPTNVTRVMIGRIEIVTPEQRALLKKIAGGPAPDLSQMRGVTADSQSDFFKHPENLAHWNDVMEGKAPYSALGLPIPELYADYLKLGRFRNALILDEQKRRPTPALNDFISKNGFAAYKIE
jgi:hypothetical protein